MAFVTDGNSGSDSDSASRKTSQSSCDICVRPCPSLPALHDNPLCHRLLAARGIRNARELEFALADLPKPATMPGIQAATTRLLQARAQAEHVLVIGDYDCDGATSTTLAVLGLQLLGLPKVSFLIPDRFKLGYGLTPPLVDKVLALGAELILTVDNGIASVDGVAAARRAGLDVVVTDHHLPPEVLPDAVALVNPNLAGSTFESGNLAGVGVMFYVLLALRAALAAQDEAAARVNLAQFLDLVAIGTVADVVVLDHLNRILVEQGLRRIRSGHTRPGVSALLQVASRPAHSLTPSDIGFAIGPRLNAAGRLADMSVGVACLLSDSADEALVLATELDALNVERRRIEKNMQVEALEQLEAIMDAPPAGSATAGSARAGSARAGSATASSATAESASTTAAPLSLVLFEPDWHQGVIGILAGRLKEHWRCPVVVFAADGDDQLKGSARSIPDLHIRDVLATLATRHEGLIERFGGHAMAAGLTLQRSALERFRTLFAAEVALQLGGRLPTRRFDVDGSLSVPERQLDNARMIERLLPWGQGCEFPLFADEFVVQHTRTVGQKHLKLTLADAQEPGPPGLEAIYFNPDSHPRVGDRITAVYALSVNRYRGHESVQLEIRHIMFASDERRDRPATVPTAAPAGMA